LLFFIILCSVFITIRIIITIFDIIFIVIAFSVTIFSLSAKLSKIICKLHISIDKEDCIEIKSLLDLFANQGFPIALSVLHIFRIDRFIQEIVIAQKEGYWQVLENTKEIHNTITNLNQQNREYYSLRFAEVQKELSGMKVELDSPR
jgi:hypothetical protein